MSYFSFKRPNLAIAYCDSLEGRGIANSSSGLFLAGPRRVGKSTFLIDELIPETEKRNWISVYVDLWANKNVNPGDLIAEAIKAKIATFDGKLTKLAKATKINKVTIMGTFVFDFSKSGLPENMTLADALRILKELAEKPVVLIIDEAQHALSTDQGINSMFAIKSARDQLNCSGDAPVLMLVFTGSNRDKLSHLVLKKDQPFFGSDITAFPLLGKDYTDAFTEWANKSLSSTNQFTKDSMWEAFNVLGHRPEILRQIAGRIAISGNAGNFSELLEKDISIWHSRIGEEFENDFNTLTLLQQAILRVLTQCEHKWLPFSEESMRSYEQITGQSELSTATVQAAIHSLRERDYIWQSGRGVYALEDASFAAWLKHYVNFKVKIDPNYNHKKLRKDEEN